MPDEAKDYFAIEDYKLGIVYAMVLLVAWVVYRRRLGFHWDLVWGALRAAAQLIGVGLFIKVIFDADSWWVNLGVLAVMVAVASWITRRRTRECNIDRLAWHAGVAIAASVALIMVPVWILVIQVRPWYHGQYLITINSMMIAFCMHGIALAAERFTSDLCAHRQKVELALSLGATPAQATHDIYARAIRASMVPAFNMMMALGIVQLPGIFTGQMLAGVSPFEAAKYQLLIIFLMVLIRAVGPMIFLGSVQPQFFTARMQLRHDKLAAGSADAAAFR